MTRVQSCHSFWKMAGFRGVVQTVRARSCVLPTSRLLQHRSRPATRLEPRYRIAILVGTERPSLRSISEIREQAVCKTYPGTGGLACIWDQCGECNDPKIHGLPHVKHQPQHGLSPPLSLTPNLFLTSNKEPGQDRPITTLMRSAVL
jgi:hypothetical protein